MIANERPATGNSRMTPVTGTDWRRGFDNLLRGEFTEWFRTRMWWAQILIWAASINLVYLMVAISSRGQPAFEQIMIFNIFMGLAGPIGTTIVMQMAIVGETRSGTAGWILSKPVSRPAFVLSKMVGSTVGLALTMVLAQGVIAYLITGLILSTWLPVAGFLAGLAVHLANIFFYLTFTLMLGAIFDHPAAVIGIPLGFLFAQQFIAGLISWLYNVLPWTLAIPLNNDAAPSIANNLMTGVPVPTFMPLIFTLIYSAIFIVVGLVVFNRREL